MTPCSVLAAVGTVGSWQPEIKQYLQQEKGRKRVCVRPKLPSEKQHRAQGFPGSNQAFLLCATGSSLDTDSEFLFLNVSSGWWVTDVRTPV